MLDKLEKRINKLEKENAKLLRYVGSLDTDLFLLNQRVEAVEENVNWAISEIDNVACVLSESE